MPVVLRDAGRRTMRNRLTRDSLNRLMRALAQSAEPGKGYRIYFVGGASFYHCDPYAQLPSIASKRFSTF